MPKKLEPGRALDVRLAVLLNGWEITGSPRGTQRLIDPVLAADPEEARRAHYGGKEPGAKAIKHRGSGWWTWHSSDLPHWSADGNAMLDLIERSGAVVKITVQPDGVYVLTSLGCRATHATAPGAVALAVLAYLEARDG